LAIEAIKSGDAETRLANGPETEVPSFLVFEAGGRTYSIEVEATEGVVDCPKYCPLPSAPEGIVGVASIRGRMTVVMDLSRETAQPSSKRRLVLLKGDSRLGLLADRVHGVVAPAPRLISRSKGSSEALWPVKAYFKYDHNRIPVLDVEHLVAS
jgi:chemotaxis signal transduction protein